MTATYSAVSLFLSYSVQSDLYMVSHSVLIIFISLNCLLIFISPTMFLEILLTVLFLIIVTRYLLICKCCSDDHEQRPPIQETQYGGYAKLVF